MSDGAAARLQAALERDIPLTRALGVTVRSWDGCTVCLAAPLAPNANHLATAFGGSLSAVATLAGWSALWLLLDRHGLEEQVVIQDASIAYRHPVTGDFTVACRLPDAAAEARFLEMVRTHGRARMTLTATVADGDRELVTFTGRYVALRR